MHSLYLFLPHSGEAREILARRIERDFADSVGWEFSKFESGLGFKKLQSEASVGTNYAACGQGSFSVLVSSPH